MGGTRRTLRLWQMIACGALALASASGCAALGLFDHAESDGTRFVEGELQAKDRAPLNELLSAARDAFSHLGYVIVEEKVEKRRAHISGQSATGDPVAVRLKRGFRATKLRIRVGDEGDEARARLLWERIQHEL